MARTKPKVLVWVCPRLARLLVSKTYAQARSPLPENNPTGRDKHRDFSSLKE
jgi:hypothetical protein